MAGKGKAAVGAPRAVIGFGDGYGFRFNNASAGWRYVWCAGYDTDEQGKRHFHHFENIRCNCPPGPQALALSSTAYEVAMGGGRGGLKTETGFGISVRGNSLIGVDGNIHVLYHKTGRVQLSEDLIIPCKEGDRGKIPADAARILEAEGVLAITPPPDAPKWDISYIHHPRYRFLVLRRNSKDLDDCFRRAREFYSPFGASFTESPMKVKFPSGAEGIFDHMQDENAYEKYQGQEFQFLWMEELTQIPSEKLYKRILRSARSSHAELKPKIFVTANPGGAGHKWFKARFINLEHAGGTPVKPGELYTEPYSGLTRMFIHSTVLDNPYILQNDPAYVAQLENEPDERERKRWFEGDFNSFEGQYFTMFRERLLVDGNGKPREAANACHVIAPRKLGANWPRAIAMDWGYAHDSAVGWGCWAPEGQLHVYREHVVSRRGSVEIGADIAIRSLPDLEQMPDPHMNLYLSHDAFNRTDEGTSKAEQVAAGIDRVLGAGAAFVLSANEEEELLDDRAAWDSVRRRQRERARQTHITVINAGTKRRSDSANLLRDYLRWWPIAAQQSEFSDAIARKILDTEGALAWYEYKRACEKRADEILPKILFWDCCPRTIAGIQAAVESEKNPEEPEKMDGDDACDMVFYLVNNFRFREAQKSRSDIVADRLQQIREREPGISVPSLILAAELNEREWLKGTGSATFARIPRRAGPSRRFAGRVN
jgi:hypothetical protein